MIIAIDGPAGSGKSSTARAVARRLGFLHLDSGALYRGFAVAALRRGSVAEDGSVSDERAVGLATEDVDAEIAEDGLRVQLDGRFVEERELRTDEVSAAASSVSRHRPVRRRVNEILRRVARDYDGHIVCEGRDMGTVVFPDAELKVWMDASVEERARRRLQQQDRPVTPRSIRSQVDRLRSRDTADSQRSESPLRQAEDAVVIDTTHLSFEEQVERIIARARQHLDMP